VFGRVNVDRFAGTAMNSQIRLTVTIKIERAQDDAACDGDFVNSSRNNLLIPLDQTRSSNVD